MRYYFKGIARNQVGTIIEDAIISVYLAGTITPASIYVELVGGALVNSVTSSSDGSFAFYVDSLDYEGTQRFKLIISKAGFTSNTYDYINVFDVASVIDTDDTFADASDSKVPSQLAAKIYIAAVSNAKVSDAAYHSDWGSVVDIAPSKKAIYDKIESPYVYKDLAEVSEPANPSTNIIRLWASDEGGFSQLNFKDSNGVGHQLARDNIHTVRNLTGSTLPSGVVVYITGSDGTLPTVGLARANSQATMPAAGVVVAPILNNATGQIMTMGDIKNINTSAFSDGDVVYVSPSTAGLITNTPPTGTSIIQRIGVIVKSHASTGSVAILIGGEFDPGLTQTFSNKTFTDQAWASPTELTLASDTITITQISHMIDTESDAVSDDLVTINGGSAGKLLALRAVHTDRTVVIKGTGNILTGGTDITLDATNKYILFTYDSALSKWVVVGGTGSGSGGGGGLSKLINQTGHGFSIGDQVYLDSTVYKKAIANTLVSSEVVGMVSVVSSLDDFTLIGGGWIDGLSGLTAGEVYFLSDSVAGGMTTTEPTTEGSVSKPVFIADSATSGYFFNMRGAVIGGGTTCYVNTFVDGDLAAGVLTVNHNFGHQYPNAPVIIDNNSKVIVPDEITYTTINALTVDLSSYGTITGTWRVIVLDSGAAQNAVVFATAAEITTGTEAGKAIAPDQLALSSPTVVTVKCSGLTDLKVPKHTSDAVGLADTTITVSANNEVTNASQPAFLATAGEQSNVTGDGTIYTVTFGSEVYDHNEDFDGTSTFTAPVTGIYHFNVSLQISGLAAANSGYITLNCSNRKHSFAQFFYGAVSGGVSIILGGSTDIDMDAGDTAKIQLGVAGATKVVDVNLSVDSRFSGHLIC